MSNLGRSRSSTGLLVKLSTRTGTRACQAGSMPRPGRSGLSVLWPTCNLDAATVIDRNDISRCQESVVDTRKNLGRSEYINCTNCQTLNSVLTRCKHTHHHQVSAAVTPSRSQLSKDVLFSRQPPSRNSTCVRCTTNPQADNTSNSPTRK